MSKVLRRILKDVKRERITKLYSKKHRLISSSLYTKLKSKTECDNCHKKLHEIPEIHHKIQVINGGNSDESNLMSVCSKCHKKLDEMNK